MAAFEMICPGGANEVAVMSYWKVGLVAGASEVGADAGADATDASGAITGAVAAYWKQVSGSGNLESGG